MTANGQLVSGTSTVVNNGQTVEFAPAAALPTGAPIQVFVDTTALDTVGNPVNAYQASFNTVGAAGTTAPAVVNVSPTNGASSMPTNVVMHLAYSEPLSASTVNTTNVYLSGVAAAVTLDATGTVIQLVASAALAAQTQYCYYVQNVQGTNGLAAQNYGACFTTGAGAQSTAPTVTAVSPADGLGSVPVNANIRVLFSGPIDPTTVSGTTIQVSGGGQTEVPSSISFSNNNQAVLITPQNALPASTQMTLTVVGVADLAGNVVATWNSGSGP